MKTILQINTVVNFGSTGRIAEEIGQMAIEKGWNSIIAYGRYDRTSQSTLIRIGSFWDTILHVLLSRLFDKHGFGSKSATRKLIQQIETIKPDIIHLHNIHGYYLNINILFEYLASTRIPIVWTLHDCWPMTGHCVHFEQVGCLKWQHSCNHCPQLRTYPKSLIFDNTKNNFQIKKQLFNLVSDLTIVTVSNWLAKITSQSFLKQNKVEVIYNGIDLQTFSNTTTEALKKRIKISDKFFILGVANVWSERKGLNDFIQLASLLSNNFQIILVGLNQNQINMLPQNIIGFKRTESIKQLVELYSVADVYINTSVEETFGLTTAEALACGTPAIVYNSTACPEIVDNETGYVIEKQNISGIIESIEKIKSNGKAKYSQACRTRALKYFNKKNQYETYFELYNSLLLSQKK